MSTVTVPQTLLIEVGTEELPPKALRKLDMAFESSIRSQLDSLGFSYSKIVSFAAPRRLAVSIKECQRKQEDKEVEKRGPAVSASFDDAGNPSKAAQGWAKANGINVEDAQRLVTDKGEWLLHKALVPGKKIDELVEEVVNNALKQLPIGKAMRWGSSDAEFIRPVHTLCVMYGEDILPATVLGIESNNQISGHRFHGEHRFSLSNAEQYNEKLQSQYVIPSYKKRMDAIEAQLLDAANALGLQADFDQALLEEISSLVEWPVVLTAKFEARFLNVPKEALIYTMKDDQKYVPLLHNDGSLAESFLFVSNIESKDPAQVISGNEKVIRPRLADAEFFFESDKKTTLKQKAKSLEDIVFQKDLGTVAEKSRRVSRICQVVGSMAKADADIISKAKDAALIAKADLASDMVMEFPSVQGIMGRHYALLDGEDDAVALAIEEQYLPRFANDRLPSSEVGRLLALSEKLDTLVGIFAVNLIPKGDKDPFALRRSAIGILRMLVKYEVDLSLKVLIDKVVAEFGDLVKNKNVNQQVLSFLLDRCKAFYADQDILTDVVNAVLAGDDLSSFNDIDKRVHAVAAFNKGDAAEALVAANKRVANILNKNGVDVNHENDVDTALHTLTAESVLFDEYQRIKARLDKSGDNKLNYHDILSQLSNLKAPLSAYFDEVMIMVDDKHVKNNRINLLSKVRKLFMSVADISLLNIER